MHLLFAGDVMLGRYVNDVLAHEMPEYVWGSTRPIWRGADFRFCNLECVLADHGAPWSATPKVFHFRSDARNVAVLRAASIDVVSLANNHTLDFGYEALGEMLTALDAAGVAHAGAGRSLMEAMQLAVTTVQDAKIGVLAFTDNEPDWEATTTRAGTYYVPVTLDDPRASTLLDAVCAAKQAVDLLIVSAHWGPNWGYKPPPSHIAFAHALVEAGATAVVGHSGHVFRGVEFYLGRPILYCLGDFVDDYAVDRTERNDESGLFILETVGDEIRNLKVYPTVIEHCQARLARPERAKEIAAKLARLCAHLGTRATWREVDGCLVLANQT